MNELQIFIKMVKATLATRLPGKARLSFRILIPFSWFKGDLFKTFSSYMVLLEAENSLILLFKNMSFLPTFVSLSEIYT